jgi:hypothetical protein
VGCATANPLCDTSVYVRVFGHIDAHTCGHRDTVFNMCVCTCTLSTRRTARCGKCGVFALDISLAHGIWDVPVMTGETKSECGREGYLICLCAPGTREHPLCGRNSAVRAESYTRISTTGSGLGVHKCAPRFVMCFPYE